MLILPIGQSDGVVQRWPWVTIGIVVLNVAALALLWGPQDRAEAEVATAVDEAAQFYAMHPELELHPPLDQLLRAPAVAPAAPSVDSEQDLSNAFGITAPPRGQRPEDPELKRARLALEQTRLDELGEKVQQAREKMPWWRLGFVPAENNLLGLFTSQFVHGGVLHLVFNLWFLWLVGCNVEDAWGRAVFPVFYLSAGAFAALAHKAFAWDSVMPVIGASGAVAGAMGAFLVKHARAHIRFFYFWGRGGFFSAPAYLMLPLWLASELFDALFIPTEWSGVASWAHVGGFVYGAGFALALRLTGVEKQIGEAIEEQSITRQDPRLLRAGELLDAGNTAQAVPILEQLARQDPRKIEVWLEMLRAARASGDVAREVRAFQSAIEQYFRQGAPETAMQLYEEMRERGLNRSLSRAVRIRVAKQYERTHAEGRACIEYERLHTESSFDVIGVQALIGHANLLLALGQRDEAVTLFQRAEEAGGVHSGVGSAVREGLVRAASLPPAGSDLLQPSRHLESVELDVATSRAPADLPFEGPRSGVRTELIVDETARVRTEPLAHAAALAESEPARVRTQPIVEPPRAATQVMVSDPEPSAAERPRTQLIVDDPDR